MAWKLKWFAVSLIYLWIFILFINYTRHTRKTVLVFNCTNFSSTIFCIIFWGTNDQLIFFLGVTIRPSKTFNSKIAIGGFSNTGSNCFKQIFWLFY